MILVTGATGFLGRRVCRLLTAREIDYTQTSFSMGLDLRQQADTSEYFKQHRPSHVIHCAAYVGGIQFGYKHSAELFHNNLLMTINLLEAARLSGVKRIVNPISNCAYPGEALWFREEEFWNGPLHESVMVYGYARKASWVGAWAYHKQYGLDVLNLILPNMYGPEDHFEEERSHALGALIMKIVRAKQLGLEEVMVWGTGKPIREWLHVDDGAEAMIRGLEVSATIEPVNIGIGQGISIIQMAEIIKEAVGYHGRLTLDPEKPDGAPHKIMDGARGEKLLGWKPERDFRTGIEDTIQWYMENNHGHG